MPKLRLMGRKAAFVGVSAAAATAAVVAVAGPALADTSELTTCTDTVRVRSQPSQSAPVIGNCKAGEKVTVDETRDGFGHLVNKKGWASVEFLDLSDSLKNKDKDDKDKDDKDNYSSDRDHDYDHSDNGLLGGLGG
jgi:uncharacterized protein YraI